ncbi:siaz-interacting nuclear protein isoform X2 [Ctenopharyngodon idella]|uniref:siaz-interacting nuclear protein isoform X2 n=1 Tax=Ctenopharyngodon idella TaxID=7959 RepID=UPI00223107A7|nr:siaz-interacting nuclear protein isoform X2 [Ctenopharyngodon idella]
MTQHNAAITQSPLNTKTDKRYMDVFKRKEPLQFTPKRQYVLAVISPLQKHDSWKTVFADGSFSGSSSPAHSNRLEEITFESPRHRGARQRRLTSSRPFSFGITFESPRSRRARQRSLTRFQPFSFDARDAARKVERERRLQEMRQMQELQWCSTFKAHPVRRYKPLIQPPAHSKTPV